MECIEYDENIKSMIEEDIVVVDKNGCIVEVSSGIENIFGTDILDKNLKELEISEFLEDLIYDNFCIDKEYSKLNILNANFSEYKEKLLVNFNNNDITIYSEDYNDGHILVFDIIRKQYITHKYKKILSDSSDLVGEVCNKEYISVDYIKQNTAKDLDNINLFQVTHENDRSRLKEIIKKSVEEGQNKETSLRISLNNNWKLYDIKILCPKNNMNFDNPLLTGEDKSEQYLFEQRRLVMNRILRHDLRNDMNVINGYASSLHNKIQDDEMEKYAQNIKSKSDELLSVSNNVRKIDTELNKLNRKIRIINLNKVIKNTISDYHNNYPNTKFRFNVPENINVLGNSLIKTAIGEVVENSIVHNKNSVEITIKANKISEDRVELSIIDDGKGIGEGEIDAIRSGIEEPLNHVSGLGLWMVKWITTVVDGELEIENRDDLSGTKVTMRFYSESVDKDNIDSDRSVMSILSKISKMNDDSTIGTSTRG